MHLKLLIDKIIEIIENEIMKKQEFGAGIWHFATYLDRYATDGYGEPRSVIEAIELAGKVTDLSYVDITIHILEESFQMNKLKKLSIKQD